MTGPAEEAAWTEAAQPHAARSDVDWPDAAWSRLLRRARRSLERTGGSLAGSVSLSEPTDAERRLVIGITGTHRAAGSASLRIRLADIDEYLRTAHGHGLAEAIELTTGIPLRNRPAEHATRAATRRRLLDQAHASRHADADWFGRWLDKLAADGWLGRLVGNGEDLSAVVTVLDALPTDGEPMPVFAERVLGDTKALADGSTPGLVLRALAAWRDTAPPTSAEAERELWEWAGVVPDDLASQVLVLNLSAVGGLLGDWLRQAADAAIPLRVTLHQLRLSPLSITAETIFVTENPAVLRAATTELGSDAPPIVCTEGVPSAAVHRLLGFAERAKLLWRNDFDWSGVRITAAALGRYRNAVPWRMTTSDYRLGGDTGVPLLGAPAPTPWDPALANAMRASDRAVMEERLLDTLLADLRHGCARTGGYSATDG